MTQIKHDVDFYFSVLGTSVANLGLRWRSEKEHEDRSQYVELGKAICKKNNFQFASMTKSPFSLVFFDGTDKIEITLKRSTLNIEIFKLNGVQNPTPPKSNTQNHSMAQFIREHIFEGRDNDFILRALLNSFGVDKNNKYINWYRSQLRRQGYTR